MPSHPLFRYIIYSYIIIRRELISRFRIRPKLGFKKEIIRHHSKSINKVLIK